MRIWLEINMIIIISYIILYIFRSFFKTSEYYRFENDIFKAIFIMILFPFIHHYFPAEIQATPIILKRFTAEMIPALKQVQNIKIEIPLIHSPQVAPININEILLFIILSGIILWLFKLFKDIYIIHSMVKNSFLIKKYKKCRLYLCPNLKVPCSNATALSN